MEISCKTRAKYANQGVDIGTVKIQNAFITTEIATVLLPSSFCPPAPPPTPVTPGKH